MQPKWIQMNRKPPPTNGFKKGHRMTSTLHRRRRTGLSRSVRHSVGLISVSGLDAA
jgi:hypothetical protein